MQGSHPGSEEMREAIKARASRVYAMIQAAQARDIARARAAGEMHKAKREAVTAEKRSDGTYTIR